MEGMVLRLIDVNLDRVGEGLRVIEDIARFSLNDVELCQRLKTLRHELLSGSYSLQQQLLAARKVERDVGFELSEEEKHEDVSAVVIANSRRVQEALRELEELAKLPDSPLTLPPVRFKQARFALYQIEQELVSRLLRQDKVKNLTGVYGIIDTSVLKGRSEVEIAQKVIRGGARVIQLRDKQRPRAELLTIARELKEVCAENGVLFIINDYLDLALAADCDGLHLGQDDLPVREARRLLPMDKLIGSSTATLSEALRAQSEGADYISVGAIYPTTSKEKFRLAGLETLREVKKAVSVPVIAIGGIDHSNVVEVIKARADGVAVIKAILLAEDVEGSTRQLVATIEEVKGGRTGL